MYLDWRPTTMTTVQRRWESQPSWAYISMVAHAKSVSRQNVKPNKQTKIQATIIHSAFIHASLWWLKDVAENTHKHNHYASLESTAFFRSPTRPTKCIAKRTSSREPHSQHTHTHKLAYTHRRKGKKLMAYCEQMKITSQTLNIHVNMFTLNIESTPPNGKKQGNEWKSVMYFLRFTFRNFVFLSPLTMRRMRRLHSPPRDIFSNNFLFVWILKWWTFRERKKTQYTLAAECTSALKTVNIPTWLAHTERASEWVERAEPNPSNGEKFE